jgi:inner membrane protein
MDILTHIFSGMAVSSVVSGKESFNLKQKAALLFTGGIGGALPDIDAISLWSGFDNTFGKIFHLSNPGKIIYSEKFWYSHHGFMHSLFACFLLILLAWGLIYSFQKKFKSLSLREWWISLRFNFHYILVFMLGFCFHLLEDLPTPEGSWKGIALLWPYKMYIGGWGKIWWWNNYDIFIIVLSVLVVNLLVNVYSHYKNYYPVRLTSLVFLIGFFFSVFQINHRNFDFNTYSGKNNYVQKEQQSKIIQKKILGKKCFSVMEQIDNKLKVKF